MASDWQVLVFGDSWADYMHPTWPQVLGRRISARVHNFAQAGSVCSGLAAQAHQALTNTQVAKASGGLLHANTLVVVHTCGNDLIQKVAEAAMGSGLLGGLLGGGAPGGGGIANCEIMRANPGSREVVMLRTFLDSMHRGGARHFLVSGVPCFLDMPVFNFIWPIIGTLVNQGQLADLGVSPGDPPQLAMEVQAAALQERWIELVEAFSKDNPDTKCIFFDEVEALHRLRRSHGAPTFDRSMWDMSMFHPSVWGHEQLAFEAHRTTAENWSVIAARAPHPEVTVGGADVEAERRAREERERKAKEEAERKAKEDADRKAKEEAERKAKENAGAVGQTSGQSFVVRVRNVKGDVTFSVSCDASWTVPKLREAIIANAPQGFIDQGMACVLALKGKFLGDGPETLTTLGISDGTQIIAVAKPQGAKSPTNKT